MATLQAPAPPQIIVVQAGGGKASLNEKVQTIVLVAGLGLGGYVAYEFFYGDACDKQGIFGSQGLIGQFTGGFNPACSLKGAFEFFTGLVDIGVGVPVELEPCPSGWTDTGLLCNEPISCASGLDFFSEGCSGGKVVGRLDNGGTCPADHPENIDGLCYRKCPDGYRHTEGMPYTCRKDGTDEGFLSKITGGLL